MSSSETKHCGLCHRPLDQSRDPRSTDCGGDCLECMAKAGDPDALAATNPVTCPECLGTGRVVVAGGDPTGWYAADHACFLCSGIGIITRRQSDWRLEGMAMRKARISRSETLKDAAERLGFDVVALSAMETGRANPAALKAANTEKGASA